MSITKQIICLLLSLFLVPVFIWQWPTSSEPLQIANVTERDERVVFASETDEIVNKKVLLFATHSHESYKPIVQKTLGKSAVYNPQENILKWNRLIADELKLSSIDTDMLNIDIMAEMEKTGASFAQSYREARRFVQQQLSFEEYDLIIDLHRDSASYDATTLKGQENYAKVAFVVGLEHPMYDWNLAYAEQLHGYLEQLMPGVSRGIIKKGGAGVDGIYNQDLAPQMLLIELGGIDNNEEELNRTLKILSKAITQLLNAQ